MLIRIRHPEASGAQVLELEELTDRAHVRPGTEHYDESNGVFTLPITRFPITSRRRLLRRLWPLRRDLKSPITALLTVRNVTRCRVEIDPGESDQTPRHILFGVNIRGDEVILASAEEHRGKRSYSISLTSLPLDVELHDVFQASDAEQPDAPDRQQPASPPVAGR